MLVFIWSHANLIWSNSTLKRIDFTHICQTHRSMAVSQNPSGDFSTLLSPQAPGSMACRVLVSFSCLVCLSKWRRAVAFICQSNQLPSKEMSFQKKERDLGDRYLVRKAFSSSRRAMATTNQSKSILKK